MRSTTRIGVTHRDLKPSNIMLTPAGVKLLDFGVGKWAPQAGDAPLAGFSSRANIIAAILKAPAPKVSDDDRALLPRLERVVAKCLAKDPDQRWQSARHLGDEARVRRLCNSSSA